MAHCLQLRQGQRIPGKRCRTCDRVIRIDARSDASVVNLAMDMTLHRLRSIGLGDQTLGTIDGQRMLDLVNEYVLAFFDKHLLGQSETLLNGPIERYPEVTILSKDWPVTARRSPKPAITMTSWCAR